MTPTQLFNPPGVPPECRDRRREVARVQWRLGDPGDPAAVIEDFCAEAGLPATDLSVPGRHEAARPGICGVAILVSAAAGAAIIGGDTGAPTPIPAVPELVAIAYHHDPEPPAPLVPTTSELVVGPWRPSWQPQEHADAVAAAIEAIKRGDVYQVNVVGHQQAAYRGDRSRVLAAVAGLSGAAYAGTIGGQDWAVASGSPECLVRVADGQVTTKPIKGTRPATATGAAELRASVKERAEHVMIVDLERNDLARLSRPGSVEVTELFALRKWSGLWQAESTVTAGLRARTGLADVLRALCPPGSVTGTPKLSALSHIAALEPVGRGPAMGGMGYLTARELVLGLTIRTVAADLDNVHVWAGGGITWRSDPMDEVAEAAAKSGPVKAVLEDR